MDFHLLDLLRSIKSAPRVERLRMNVVNSEPELCSERALLITESYKKTEGEPIILRRAKALRDILENMSIFIVNDELIVGHMAEKYRSAPVFPEMAVEWLIEELDTLEEREVDPFKVDEKVKKDLQSIFPYWKGKTVREYVFNHMPEETRFLRENAKVFSITAHEETGLGHVLLDYEKVIKKGFNGIKEEIEAKIEKIEFKDKDDLARFNFLRAAQIVCEAAINFARRYAKLAAAKIEETEDPVRKKELKEITGICKRVPEFSARSFYEALQAIWFVEIISQIETNSNSYSLGRFDQYLYTYLEEDIKKAVLNWEKAQELLDCFWIKFNETVLLYKKESAMVTSGFPMGQNLVIGGIDPLGNDVTNELSYLCLNAQKHIRFGQPNFSVRMSKKTSSDFLRSTCEVIRLGTGMPQIFNDEIIIPSMLKRGIKLEDARNYGVVGCVENAILGQWGRENGGYLSLPKVLELTLNHGKCLLAGKKVGSDLGGLDTYNTFEYLMEAYKKELSYFIKHLVIENHIIDKIHAEKAPVPFVSVLVPGCIETSRDVTAGGAKYNYTCPTGVGVANTADSLAAIKKVVFEERKISKEELMKYCKENFQGSEDIRRMLKNYPPKYGNDIDYVDIIAKEVFNLYSDEINKYTDYRGGSFEPGFTAVTANIALGHDVGATPDGRKAMEPLAEGLSPVIGVEINGPTAILKSVSKMDLIKAANGHILNLRFNQQILKQEKGFTSLMAILRTCCELNVMHVQFNTISSEILRKAQRHPEKYQDLVIRVAGYSAFFTELSKEVQDIIIGRTEHDF